MQTLPIRLLPGQDLRRALEDALKAQGCAAAFVISGMGSLSKAAIRFAGAEEATAIDCDLEILTLAGSISPDGAHLHISASRASGEVLGGHVAHGCAVRTTAEVLLMLLPEWEFGREMDAATGYKELVVRRKT